VNLREMLDKVNGERLDTRISQAGKPLGVTCRTGFHLNRKKDKRHLRRMEKASLRDF